MNNFKLTYIKGKGNKRNLLIEYLISIGVDVKVVEHSKEIRGMKASYVIVDELEEVVRDEY